MVAPPTSSVMEGSSITLQCVVPGCVVPGCVVSWEGPQGTLPSAPGGVLTLENISPSDGGHYNCTSVCGAFVLSAMVTVFVQGIRCHWGRERGEGDDWGRERGEGDDWEGRGEEGDDWGRERGEGDDWGRERGEGDEGLSYKAYPQKTHLNN